MDVSLTERQWAVVVETLRQHGGKSHGLLADSVEKQVTEPQRVDNAEAVNAVASVLYESPRFAEDAALGRVGPVYLADQIVRRLQAEGCLRAAEPPESEGEGG